MTGNGSDGEAQGAVVVPIQAHANRFEDEGPYSKLRAGRWPLDRPDVAVWWDCSCGDCGPLLWCAGEILSDEMAAAVRAGRATHEAETRHREDPDYSAEGRHNACGYYHDLNVPCPVPASSPRGQTTRALRPSRVPAEALDRLAAVNELRTWLDEMEREAVVGCRLAGCKWGEMGAVVGISRQGAHNKWGNITAGLETAGIIETPDPTS